MNKFYFGFFIVFLVGMGVVLSADIINLESISQDDLFIDVFSGDAISFDFMGDNHRVLVNEIQSRGIDITIFVNRNTEQAEGNRLPSYVTLKPEDSVRIDVNKDRVNDLIIGLVGFDLDKNKATLVVREPRTDEERGNKIIKQVNLEDVDRNGNNNQNSAARASIFDFDAVKIVNILTVMLFVIIIVLGYLLVRKKD